MLAIAKQHFPGVTTLETRKSGGIRDALAAAYAAGYYAAHGVVLGGDDDADGPLTPADFEPHSRAITMIEAITAGCVYADLAIESQAGRFGPPPRRSMVARLRVHEEIIECFDGDTRAAIDRMEVLKDFALDPAHDLLHAVRYWRGDGGGGRCSDNDAAIALRLLKEIAEMDGPASPAEQMALEPVSQRLWRSFNWR